MQHATFRKTVQSSGFPLRSLWSRSDSKILAIGLWRNASVAFEQTTEEDEIVVTYVASDLLNCLEILLQEPL